MHLNPNTQVILLLAGHFNGSPAGDARPLTVGEWGRLAEFLRATGIEPQALLEKDALGPLRGYVDKNITIERIEALLRRGTAMALALEKWSRANIWVISRADAAYPDRLKKRLGQMSPPILYGCGNSKLLDKGGIGIVGSRDISAQDLAYTEELARKTAISGFSVVSGGAKGVDQTAMLSALEIEGSVVGVLADSLLRATTSQKYRQHLVINNLLLVSPFSPEAPFNAGNAMQRNKYIYCLSDASVVVHSGHPETSKSGRGGGTWTGAMENLKKAWVPVWVKPSKDTKSGNSAIFEAGARWLPNQLADLEMALLVLEPDVQSSTSVQDALTVLDNALDGDILEQPAGVADNEAREPVELKSSTADRLEKTAEPAETKPVYQVSNISSGFYDYFFWLVEPLLTESKTADELSGLLRVNKSQLNIWLKQAVIDKKIVKRNKPVRYLWNGDYVHQGSLLE